jgi:hypothetical protein
MLQLFFLRKLNIPQPVYGALVEIDLNSDNYIFTKSQSPILLAPTLVSEYYLRLYIQKTTGPFIDGEIIRGVVKLQIPGGIFLQKKFIIIVMSNE